MEIKFQIIPEQNLIVHKLTEILTLIVTLNTQKHLFSIRNGIP